ncbi:HAD family hydrolase [Longimicrobium sp.]|uniref:HAD family hydrolase n=1 Tax=Longimicrobium sp. TaxID=2029185 RepID=UPI002C937649|nr:HAD family hydrolase [Longimicrobium sp.]HSU16778.1 HAD family hydrolase [Longimicrobium sp.]
MTAAPLPRAILFDLDGTLIDTWRLYGESYQRALEPFLGHRLTDEDVARLRPTSERGFLRELLGPERGDACHAEFRRHYEELHGALADGVYDGVREMLAALRSAGYPLGIVTGKGRHAWEVTEREMALGPFAVVVTEDDAEAPKPDPRGLLAAAREMAVSPAEVVYVGDSTVDLEAGRAAGMRTAAVLWPKTGEGEAERFVNRIASLSPDWIFRHPADLTRTFARWC